ncbi:hypothetical protein FE257_012781 [Aspergillus nanangensis]|uniref:Uncharacterized protein n=1 Tax=Aspergillus nanangensis TaxID=2582783 RepID=A0AAD4CFJ1_ASPNN|nr:hypothetical protein FE257_012781 [Aspergillus nanangensis]
MVASDRSSNPNAAAAEARPPVTYIAIMATSLPTRTKGTLSDPSPTILVGSGPARSIAPLSPLATGYRDNGLDISAKIAIGVCVPVTVLIVAAVAFYFWRQRRQKKKNSGPEHGGSSSRRLFGRKYELEGNEISLPAEKTGQQPQSELDTTREIRELGGETDSEVKKPSVIAELPGDYTPAELPAGQDCQEISTMCRERHHNEDDVPSANLGRT